MNQPGSGASDELSSRILFVISVGLIAIPVLRDQISYLTSEGHEVHVAAADDADLMQLVQSQGGHFHPWEITRSVSGVASEMTALRHLAHTIRVVKPGVLVAGTPKAGLFGVVLGRLLRVPRVLYTLHGLRLEGGKGAARLYMWLLEFVACRMATDVHVVGPDLLMRARRLRVLGAGRGVVVGEGSASGIDLGRFYPRTKEWIGHARIAEGLSPSEPVVGFVGRITHDKGLREIQCLADRMQKKHPHSTLVLVGEPDYSHQQDPSLLEELRSRPNVRFMGRRAEMGRIFPMFDLLVLPSRREGLPTVVLEAAACGVPSVMYTCTGAVDAVEHGSTGRLVPIGQEDAFVQTALDLIQRDDVRGAMGIQARRRIVTAFDQDKFLPKLGALYFGNRPARDPASTRPPGRDR